MPRCPQAMPCGRLATMTRSGTIRRTGVAWTMINAASAGQDDVLSALKAGRSYAVLRTGAFEERHHDTPRASTSTTGTVTVHLNGHRRRSSSSARTA